MDEDLLRQLLASQDDGLGISPTAEMMMMSSAMAEDPDSIDPALLAAIQQQAQQSIRVNPPRMVSTITEVNDDDDEWIEDETLLERIAALKEMFPEGVQKAVGTLNRTVVNTSKLAYNKGRSAAWWSVTMNFHSRV
jgi:hypothetical protein